MFRVKTGFGIRRTKRGSIIHSVNERYLRTDIPNGIGTHLHSHPLFIIIPTRKCLMKQINFFENEKVKNVVLLTSILNDIKKIDVQIYQKLISLRLNKTNYNNDKNDKKNFYIFSNIFHKETYVKKGGENESESEYERKVIEKSVGWYMKEVENKIPVYLMVNDEKEKGNEGICNVKSIKEIVDMYYKELSDIIMVEEEEEEEIEGEKDGKMIMEKDKKKNEGKGKGKGQRDVFKYEDHYSANRVNEMIKNQENQKVNVEDGGRNIIGRLFQGKLNMNSFNRKRGNVEVFSKNMKGINFIEIEGLLNLNRGIHGDCVIVEVINKQENVLNGKIVRIVERKKKQFYGSIKTNPLSSSTSSSSIVMFVPVSNKYPKIRLRTRQQFQLKGKRIIVQIDSWSNDSRYPFGHYVNMIGDIGDIETETRIVLEEYEIPYQDFNESVVNCLPPENWKISEEEINKRVDLRNECVLSIDPPGCTDIDDALHVNILENGNYQIGVHIADVSHFVKENTELDKEAINRSNSVYLVQKRINMLPKILTEVLCSIREGEDKLAFSCIWEIEKSTCKIVGTKFCKTVIHSRAALTYEQAQNIIDSKQRMDKIAKSLRVLQQVSNILRERRFDNGALSLLKPEVKFDIDIDNMTPTDMEMYQQKKSHHLVEEFMLLANVSVAQQIVDKFPLFAILRRHPPPTPQKFTDLQRDLATFGKKLDISTSKKFSQSLQTMELQGNQYFGSLIRMAAARRVEQAVYFSSGELSGTNRFHYGLALPLYTHFTSPIRRYADILVHRLLTRSINYHDPTQTLNNLKSNSIICQICKRMNERNRAARYASRASVNLYTLTFFKDKTITKFGYITRVLENGIVVLVPTFGFDSFIKLKGSNYNYDQKSRSFTKGNVVLRIFTKVQVIIRVKTDDNLRDYLFLEIVKEEEEEEEIEKEVVKSNKDKMVIDDNEKEEDEMELEEVIEIKRKVPKTIQEVEIVEKEIGDEEDVINMEIDIDNNDFDEQEEDPERKRKRDDDQNTDNNEERPQKRFKNM